MITVLVAVVLYGAVLMAVLRCVRILNERKRIDSALRQLEDDLW